MRSCATMKSNRGLFQTRKTETAYSRSSKKINRPSKERFGGPPGGGVRSLILRNRLGVITLSRAGIPLLRVKTADTRCLIESLEQRDALGSHDEHSDAVWFQTAS